MPVNLTRHGRLLFALVLAGLFHAALILGISINRPRPNEIDKTLDVILVVNHSLEPPAKADFLAQSPQKGGGESKKRTLPRATPKLAAPIEPKVALTPRNSIKEEPEDTPTKHKEVALPEPRTEKPIADEKTVDEENLESSPNSVLQVPKSDKKTVGGVAHKTAIEPAAEPPRFSSGLLSQQIAEVSTEFNKSREDQAKRHRMVYINSVNAHKYHAAAYEATWQEKVEQIGNLNYPEEARKQNLSGSLLLTVAIKADGSIYSMVVRQSSGEPVLDEAAQRIVRLAAPFAAVPKELQEEGDVFIITRTWLFSADNRLETGN